MTTSEYFDISGALGLIHRDFSLSRVEREISDICAELEVSKPDLDHRHRRGYLNLMNTITKTAGSGLGVYLMGDRITFSGLLNFGIYSEKTAAYLKTPALVDLEKDLGEIKGRDFYSRTLMPNEQAEIIISIAVRRVALALRTGEPVQMLAASPKQENISLIERLLDTLKTDGDFTFSAAEAQQLTDEIKRRTIVAAATQIKLA
jgi:hypothetical protein